MALLWKKKLINDLTGVFKTVAAFQLSSFVNGSKYKGYLDQSQHSICNTLHWTITALWLVRISCDKCCALIGQSAFISRSIHSNYSVASQPPTWKNLLNSYCHSQKQDLIPSVDICGILWPSGSVCCWTLKGKSLVFCKALLSSKFVGIQSNLTEDCLLLLLVLCQFHGRKHALCSLCGHVEDTKVLLGALSQETVR